MVGLDKDGVRHVDECSALVSFFGPTSNLGSDVTSFKGVIYVIKVSILTYIYFRIFQKIYFTGIVFEPVSNSGSDVTFF